MARNVNENRTSRVNLRCEITKGKSQVWVRALPFYILVEVCCDGVAAGLGKQPEAMS
jgi:hypothetical protein